MLFKTILSSIAMCALFCASEVLAEPLRESTTLDEVMNIALQHSPLVARVGAEVAAQRAIGMEIQARENPTVDSEIRWPSPKGDDADANEVTVAVSQPLRLSDFGVRERVNGLIQAAASAEERSEILALAQRVRLAYVRACALERRAREAAQYAETTARIQSGVKRSSDAGLTSNGEELLFLAEVAKARLEVKAVEVNLKRARAELSKIAGYPITATLGRPPHRSLPDLEVLLEEGAKFPVHERAELARKLANEQVRQAELDSYGTIVPRLVYERTNERADYFGVGISVELPVNNRSAGERVRASAEGRAAEKQTAYLSGDAYRHEVAALLDELRLSSEAIVSYEEEILPALTRAAANEEQLYTAGKSTTTRLWQILAALSEAQIEVVRRAVQLALDQGELTALTGVDF